MIPGLRLVVPVVGVFLEVLLWCLIQPTSADERRDVMQPVVRLAAGTVSIGSRLITFRTPLFDQRTRQETLELTWKAGSMTARCYRLIVAKEDINI